MSSFGWADRAVTDALEAGSLDAMLIDFFPVLKNTPSWIPGANFKRKALLLRESMRETIEVTYRRVKEAMALGTAKPSFVSSILEEESRKGRLSQDDKDGIIGRRRHPIQWFITYTILMTFILATVLYPDVCKKAQAEIDEIVGVERLPDVDDRNLMPYLEHVLLEVYRWNPPVPLCVPHQLELIGDDEYRGRCIPSGRIVIANIWRMAHNHTLYPNPVEFCPERYSKLDVSTAEFRDPRKFVFGFGRRLCPGRQFADVTVWLAIASMIALLDISKARDAAGNVIMPVPAFASGAVSHLKPPSFLRDEWLFPPRPSLVIKSQLNTDEGRQYVTAAPLTCSQPPSTVPSVRIARDLHQLETSESAGIRTLSAWNIPDTYRYSFAGLHTFIAVDDQPIPAVNQVDSDMIKLLEDTFPAAEKLEMQNEEDAKACESIREAQVAQHVPHIRAYYAFTGQQHRNSA